MSLFLNSECFLCIERQILANFRSFLGVFWLLCVFFWQAWYSNIQCFLFKWGYSSLGCLSSKKPDYDSLNPLGLSFTFGMTTRNYKAVTLDDCMQQLMHCRIAVTLLRGEIWWCEFAKPSVVQFCLGNLVSALQRSMVVSSSLGRHQD